MAEASGPRNDFKFILNSVRADAMQAVAQELTTLFPLDLPNALNIVQNTPLILLDKLSAQQARITGTYAIRLKALGADVQITAQPVGKLQVLRWPLMPDITKRPGNHVICPNCGVRLQMQVLAVPEATAPAAAPAESAPKPPAAPPEVMRPASPPPTAPQPPPQQAAPSSPAPQPAPPPPDIEDDDEVILEPLGSEEQVELMNDTVELIESPPAAPPSAPPPHPPPAARAEPKPEPATVGAPMGGNGSCRVTLVGKTRGKKKQDAAELMSRYMGIAPEEALMELSKTVVTVAKDLSQEEAAQCQAEFADIGVKVKIRG
jgi:ribosomal protein L7/L12